VDESNQQGQIALVFASCFDRREVFASFLEKGANPHHKGKSGNSVADIAISQGNYGLAPSLVASKENK
jgi:ankyrin repeat protein